MPPRFLLDENSRGPLWDAIQRYNEVSTVLIDATRVGEDRAPPLGASDAEVLAWCEAAGRILISRDKRTLPEQLQRHLKAGRHCPGMFLLRPGRSIRAVVGFLALAADASDAKEWRDSLVYVP
jgi:hypothetical protein